MKANAQSHTHSQFATANATPKIAKEYVLPTHTFELNNKIRKLSRTEKTLAKTKYSGKKQLLFL